MDKDDRVNEQGPDVSGTDRDEPAEVSLTIDGLAFRVPSGSMTGAELRRLAHPPISSDRDIWIEAEGGGDRMVADAQSVRVAEGMRLFSVPAQISAG
jgi:hypothetical protein